MKRKKFIPKKDQLPILTYIEVIETNEEMGVSTSQPSCSRQSSTSQDKGDVEIRKSPSTKQERCTLRNLNETEADKKLKDCGLFEEGMTKAEKKNILNLIEESKQSAKNVENVETDVTANTNKNSQDLFDDFEIEVKRLKLNNNDSTETSAKTRYEKATKPSQIKSSLKNKRELTRKFCSTIPKTNHAQWTQLYPPQDITPDKYSAIIRNYFDRYFEILSAAQRQLPHFIQWGNPVVVGRHYRDSIEFLRPGKRQVNKRMLNQSPTPISEDDTESTSTTKANYTPRTVNSKDSLSDVEENGDNAVDIADNDTKDNEFDPDFEIIAKPNGSIREKKVPNEKKQLIKKNVSHRDNFASLKQKLLQTNVPSTSSGELRNLSPRQSVNSSKLDDNESTRDPLLEKILKNANLSGSRKNFYTKNESNIDLVTRRSLGLRRESARSNSVTPPVTNCPICNKTFRQDIIEAHASSCGAGSDEERTPRASTPDNKFRCYKCNQLILLVHRQRHVSECLPPAFNEDDDESNNDDDDFETLSNVTVHSRVTSSSSIRSKNYFLDKLSTAENSDKL